MLKFFDDRDGFTLIELMVVVAILAVLAVVAVPRVMGALQEARNSEAKADASAIQAAFDRYFLENEEFPAEADIAEPTDLQTELGEYLDLRGADSIEEDDFEYTLSGDIYELKLVFTNATGDFHECVITQEEISWETWTD